MGRGGDNHSSVPPAGQPAEWTCKPKPPTGLAGAVPTPTRCSKRCRSNFAAIWLTKKNGRAIVAPPKASPPSKAAEGRPRQSRPAPPTGLFPAGDAYRGGQRVGTGRCGMSDCELLSPPPTSPSAPDLGPGDHRRPDQNERRLQPAPSPPHGDQVRLAARNQSLDDAWVHGH